MVNFNRGTYSQLGQRAPVGTRCALVIFAATLTKVLQPCGAARHPAKGATADPRQRGLGLAMSTPRRSPLGSKPPVHRTRSAVGHRHWETEPSPRRRDCDGPRRQRRGPPLLRSPGHGPDRGLPGRSRSDLQHAPKTDFDLCHSPCTWRFNREDGRNAGTEGFTLGSSALSDFGRISVVACDEQRRAPDGSPSSSESPASMVYP